LSREGQAIDLPMYGGAFSAATSEPEHKRA
jgi:hypothetical protein